MRRGEVVVVDGKRPGRPQGGESHPRLARPRPRQYASLNSRGRLQIVSFYVDRDTVYVTGTMVYRTLFAGALGLATVRARVVSSATPGYGIVVGGQGPGRTGE